MPVPPNSIEELVKILVVEQLPAMPHSALSVLQLDNDVSKVNINDLVRPIEADPGLAAQVLKFLNSSYFGFQSSISNVKQGVALIGIRIVKNFVLWKAVFSLIPKVSGGNFDVSQLWQDSLRRAMFSRFLMAELKKGDPEIAFAAALLQDMAIPVLLKLKGESYAKVLAELGTSPENVRLTDLENKHFGWNHAQAGDILGKNWKLPAQLTDLISQHNLIEDGVSGFETEPERAAVAVSAFLPMASRVQWSEEATFRRYFNRIAPNRENLLLNLFDKVDRAFEQYATIIQISKPKRPLADYLN
ncbi:phosphohydrolase [Planctomycetales bacterium]|nr:phosphohydrolase [Planctomycetales bacterium]